MFRKQVSFNTHDTSISTDSDGRITVRLGVAIRCELILQSLMHRAKHGALNADLLKVLRKKNKGYTVGDVRHAAKRLKRMGLLRTEERYSADIDRVISTRYFPTPKALNAFRALMKQLAEGGPVSVPKP